MYKHVNKCTHFWLCVWRPEVNHGYHCSGASPRILLGLHLLLRPGALWFGKGSWPASFQGSICLLVPSFSARLIGPRHRNQFLTWVLRIWTHASEARTLLSKLSTHHFCVHVWCWELNPGPHNCWASTFPLSYSLSSAQGVLEEEGPSPLGPWWPRVTEEEGSREPQTWIPQR